jgi:AcrR family transcriptional regulator
MNAMAPPTRTPRIAWIDAGLSALAAGGPDAVRIEPLAQALGVTRGGFYWHFADRRAFLDEMLDEWERRSIDEVIKRVDHHGGDAEIRSRLAGELTFAGDLAAIDLAVRHWARTEPGVATRLRRVDDRRMEFLRSQLEPIAADDDDLEARCLIAFAVAVASDLIAAEHPRGTRDDVLDTITRRLFTP